MTKQPSEGQLMGTGCKLNLALTDSHNAEGGTHTDNHWSTIALEAAGYAKLHQVSAGLLAYDQSKHCKASMR